MRRRLAKAAVTVTAALIAVTGASLPSAGAQVTKGAGPSVVLEKTALRPGQRIVVTLQGWRSTNVTISVCGNLARRGSVDCDLVGSQSLKLTNGDGPTLWELVVSTPPTTCPCVVRVSNAGIGNEAVFIPIELLGVPIGPVVGPEFLAPLSVSISASRAVHGLLATVRSSLGGPSSYRVKVRVRNVSPERLPNVVLAGSAGRNGNDTAASFDVPPPGDLEPGQTWQHDLLVTLPAPLLARATWRVIASGAGAPVEARTSTHRTPVAFLLLAVALGIDLVAMPVYFGNRRRMRREAEELASEDEDEEEFPFFAPLIPSPLPKPKAAGDERSGEGDRAAGRRAEEAEVSHGRCVAVEQMADVEPTKSDLMSRLPAR